ncbi:MAG TPA: hypothetical protein VIJ27_06130 [Mucilaginibacter sp.]
MDKLTDRNFDTTITPNDGHKRSAEKKAEIAEIAKSYNRQRSPERILKNEMLAIHYKMEEYVMDQETTFEQMCTIQDFVKYFLKILGIKKGEFANYLEINDSNLNKYYNNDRRFNPVLAMKFGHFFHTPADLWLKVQFKNELLYFQMETKSEEKYEKYDYKKALQMA